MSRQLSDNAKEAIYAQQTEEAFLMLLTISHDSFEDDIRLVNDAYELLPEAGVRGVVSRGEEYIYLPFNVNLPVQDDTGIAKANISIDNVDRRMVSLVRSADSALNINIEVILSSDPDTVEVSISDFRLETVTYDALTISGDISVEYFDLEPFPSKRFTPSDFPGIF